MCRSTGEMGARGGQAVGRGWGLQSVHQASGLFYMGLTVPHGWEEEEEEEASASSALRELELEA